MNRYEIDGFISEMDKIASMAAIKETVPWGISRGLMGGGSTVTIGLTMNKVLQDLKEKQKKAKNRWEVAKALLPLAAVGTAIGLFKGMGEKAVESSISKMMRIK